MMFTFQSSDRSCQGVVHFGQVHHDWSIVTGGDGVVNVVGTRRVESVVPLRRKSITGFDLIVMSFIPMEKRVVYLHQ